jgi:hypothetical protein
MEGTRCIRWICGAGTRRGAVEQNEQSKDDAAEQVWCHLIDRLTKPTHRTLVVEDKGMLVRSLVRLLVSLLVTVGVTFVSVADTAQPAISYVSSYNGAAADYRISRSGKSITVAPLVLLQPGDRVSVVVPSGKLGAKTITLSIDGKLHTVDSNRPYCVGVSDGVCGAHPIESAGAGRTVAAVLKNIFASVGPLFAMAQEDYYSNKVDQMTSRGAGSKPSMPLLQTTPRPGASLTGGALAIPWLGGVAPFHVRVFDAAGQLVAEKQDVSTNQVRFDSALTPGTYRVEVEDSSGTKATGSFDIVPESMIPRLSDDEVEELKHLPASLSVPLSAGMLAHKGPHHEWNFAAYQQLAAVPDSYPNVQPLRYLLTEAAN